MNTGFIVCLCCALAIGYGFYRFIRALIGTVIDSDEPTQKSQKRNNGGMTTCRGVQLPALHKDCIQHSKVANQNREAQEAYTSNGQKSKKINWFKLFLLHELFCSHNHYHSNQSNSHDHYHDYFDHNQYY